MIRCRLFALIAGLLFFSSISFAQNAFDSTAYIPVGEEIANYLKPLASINVTVAVEDAKENGNNNSSQDDCKHLIPPTPSGYLSISIIGIYSLMFIVQTSFSSFFCFYICIVLKVNVIGCMKSIFKAS